jgi:ABC-2 type transport system permease protein
MKFWEIFRFEFAYQIKRVWTWLIFGILLILNFLMARDGSLSEALYADFFVNSPFAIAKSTVFGTLIWLVAAPIIAGAAAARDVEMRMHPLVYTSPINKFQYLGGRFLAALALNVFLLLAVQIGILLAIYLPGVEPTLIGPFRPAAYLTAYAYISLANAFVATAIQFALAASSGKPTASYLGSVLLIFMGFFIASIVLFKRGLGTLLDPIGIRFIVEDIAHLWTTVEKSWRLLQLEGIILENRLLWLSIGTVAMLITFIAFRFSHRTESTSWLQRIRLIVAFKNPTKKISNAEETISISSVARKFGLSMQVHQTFAIAWTSFRTLATSWAGIALLIPIPLITVPVVIDQMQAGGGVLVPTTIRVIRELTGSLSEELSRWVIIPAFIVFFAGELVWREREARVGDITDTMPGSEWAPLLGKFLGLGFLLALFTTFLTGAGILAQIILGYHHFEIGLYLKIMFGLQLSEYLLFAVLALAVHVMIDQKYIGHLVAILIYVFIALSSLFGIEHNLLVFGAGPVWSYTDMRGFGSSLLPWLWFKIYWASWALLLAAVARLLWVRGRESNIHIRLQWAKRRFNGATAWISGLALSFILILGGFIFYNTNILNQYLTDTAKKARQAKYEQLYGRYRNLNNPDLSSVNLKVEIYPEKKTVDIYGIYHLVNESGLPIDSILLATVPEVEMGEIQFDRPVTDILDGEDFGQHLYTLQTPLNPGDSLKLTFDIHVEPKGFRENGADNSIVENGTFFTNNWLPSIGYRANRELILPGDRREYGLPPRPLIASLYDTETLKQRGNGILFEAVVCTSENQIAGAPGVLRQSWTEKGRSYFHYSTDEPIGTEWAFFSARYTLTKAKWINPEDTTKSVTIQIFHQPEHTAHLDRMIDGIQASLTYYTKNFGPYRHHHITVAEGPGDGTGLHADASMLTHSEGFSEWSPTDEPGSIDFPYAIIAHEMAHQWTVPYANVEGAPVMSESVAWYYGLKVVEHTKGKDDLRKYLSVMRQPHPIAPIRRGEPLLRGLDKYMSYRRGPFALYTISEYIGEDSINLALRRMLEKHRAKRSPLATTLDLYRELQNVTPDSLKYLLHDLFEVNTYWNLETEKTTVEKIDSGNWQVVLDLKASKIIFDSAGVETEVPMNDWIDIGVFAQGGATNNPLYLEKHRIRSGKQTITITVNEEPYRTGIDPYHLLIDLKTEDNVKDLVQKTQEQD